MFVTTTVANKYADNRSSTLRLALAHYRLYATSRVSVYSLTLSFGHIALLFLGFASLLLGRQVNSLRISLNSNMYAAYLSVSERLGRVAGRRACRSEVEVRRATGAVQNATGWPAARPARTQPGATRVIYQPTNSSKCHT